MLVGYRASSGNLHVHHERRQNHLGYIKQVIGEGFRKAQLLYAYRNHQNYPGIMT
jgi:hypothetical protein